MTEHRNPSNNLARHLRIHDGRVFEVSNRRRDVIYLRCQTKHCRGTAKIIGNNDIVLANRHSAVCFSDGLCQLKADFRYALKSALKKNYWKLKVLYETVVLLFPPEVKVEVPYNSIKNSLKEWRKSIYPPNPTGLEEMARQLARPENSRLTEYDVGRLSCLPITDSLGKTHLLLYDPEFVELAFRNVVRLFIDATFQTTPNLRDVYQLLTILGVTYDHALPCAHVLMASKTEVAYTAVLKEIFKLISGANVRIVMTDFEQALRNASKSVFTNAHVTGCNVHYDRALLKQVKKLKLNNLVREDEAAKMFVRKIMALAFLPENMIFVEYQSLINALSPALRAAFRDFIRYYERQWLTIIKPVGFCVHGLSRRTNNVTESYNSVLADAMGSHPSAWSFLVKLLKLTSNARDDFQSLRRNKTINRHPRYSSVYKQTELVAAWKQLYRGDISSNEFLEKAAMLKGHIRQRLAIIVNNVSEEDVELVEVPQNIPAVEDPDYDHGIFDLLLFDDVQIDEEEPAQANNHVSESESSLHSPVESENEEENVADIAPVPAPALNVDDENLIDEIDDADQINGPNYLNDNGDGEVQGNAEQGLEAAHPLEQAYRLEEAHRIEAAHGLEANVQILSSDEESIVDIPDDTDSDGDEVIVIENVIDNRPTVSIASTSAAAVQLQSAKVSRSKKRNLQRKRNRQMKVANDNMHRRPRGRKRRGKKGRKAERCVVCLTEDVTHIFIPCGHNCCCERCAIRLTSGVNNTCPKCRGQIQLANRVFSET